MPQPVLEIGVLGLEVGADLGIVAVPQPVVLVDAHVAVALEAVRPSGGNRRLHGRRLAG